MKEISKYILSTISIVLCLAFHSFAQSERYSYHLEDSKSLNLIIQDLKNDYGLEFSYPSEIISEYQINQENFSATNLFDLIKSILSSTDLEFQIIDKRKILLRPKRIIEVENYVSTKSKPIKNTWRGKR